MSNVNLKRNLARYIDAGFPIIYINTFEEEKVDELVTSISAGREIYEWNGTNGYIDFETKAPMQEDCSLEMLLNQMKDRELLDRKIILLKDIVPYLDDSKIISKIKGIARMICNGVEATIIMVSNIVVIPKELEKFITILEVMRLSKLS